MVCRCCTKLCLHLLISSPLCHTITILYSVNMSGVQKEWQTVVSYQRSNGLETSEASCSPRCSNLSICHMIAMLSCKCAALFPVHTGILCVMVSTEKLMYYQALYGDLKEKYCQVSFMKSLQTTRKWHVQQTYRGTIGFRETEKY